MYFPLSVIGRELLVADASELPCDGNSRLGMPY
uniref:Uncharacterized protein n=1 Tax=Oryza punctata TaxID=4537 RepID=A0A0E0MCI1_ORYPU